MEKLNELVEQAKFVADWHGSDWSSALCQDKHGNQAHEIICESRGEAVISTGSNSNEASWLCDYLELCSPANILAIAEAFQALQQRDELAAENAILKSGIGFFSYGTDSGFEENDSAEKAIAAADSDIDYYRGDACDGWSEETDCTVWGVILQRATMIDERPRTEEDSYLGSHISSICDYALLPNLATPATDAYLNSVRADAVQGLADAWYAIANETSEGVSISDSTRLKYRQRADDAADFAAQLRAGKDGE